MGGDGSEAGRGHLHSPVQGQRNSARIPKGGHASAQSWRTDGRVHRERVEGRGRFLQKMLHLEQSAGDMGLEYSGKFE